MGLYCGVDLHSNNGVYALVDDQGRRRGQRRLENDLATVLEFLAPHRDELVSIGVESTYNWYWLVDGLQEAAYAVQLANPNAMQQYDGIKHANDANDAYYLAELQRLGILPVGYIYPQAERSLRDLLRRRMLVVRYRTGLQLSLQNLLVRETGERYSWRRTSKLDDEAFDELLSDDVLRFTAREQRRLIWQVDETVQRLEGEALGLAKERPEHELLRTIPGVGQLLAMVIMLETGTIERFPTVGNYTSYCRLVKACKESNGKKKGSNNAKNGNKYLAWAWSEAAFHARMWCPAAQRWYQKKCQRSLKMVADKALAAKFCKAGYYMLQRHQPFELERIFS